MLWLQWVVTVCQNVTLCPPLRCDSVCCWYVLFFASFKPAVLYGPRDVAMWQQVSRMYCYWRIKKCPRSPCDLSCSIESLMHFHSTLEAVKYAAYQYIRACMPFVWSVKTQYNQMFVIFFEMFTVMHSNVCDQSLLNIRDVKPKYSRPSP